MSTAFEATPIGLQGLLFPRPEPSPAADADASPPGPNDASREVLADASRLEPGDASLGAQDDASRAGEHDPSRAGEQDVSRAGEDDASPPAPRPCSWCRRPIPAAARRDAVHCSVRCRQATHRFRRQVEARAVAAEPRRLAVADPPYPGLARRYYADHPDYGGEVDHAALVRQLVTFDGWALATSSDALPEVLALARAVEPRVRVAAWTRGGRRAEAREPVRAWEPVLYVSARADIVRRQPTDTLVWHARPRVSDPGRVIGAKPARWWSWVFGLIGAAAQDELHDLFPGSGGGARAWEAMQRGVTAAAD